MRQAVFLALHTERFRHAVFSWDYGAELQALCGAPMTAYLQARIQCAIEDALLADDRITQVDGFAFERTGQQSLTVTFTVHTTQGDFSTSFDYESEVIV